MYKYKGMNLKQQKSGNMKLKHLISCLQCISGPQTTIFKALIILCLVSLNAEQQCSTLYNYRQTK